MPANPKGHRTEKEIEADEARKAWWTEERRKAKSEWMSEFKSELVKTDEWRQRLSEGTRRSRGALR